VSPPPFARVGIIGLGLIGGSVALAVRRRWPAALVVGVDRPDVLDAARTLGAVNVTAADLRSMGAVDLVILAAPVLTNIETLKRLPAAIAGNAVVTDVGSTKLAIMEAARDLPARLAFVGGHPLAGTAQAGIHFASPDLFKNRRWVLTPDGNSAESAVARLDEFLRALGAETCQMSAEAHDRVTAWVSHLPQLAASALMRVVGDAVGDEGLQFSGTGLRDTTRLAGSPAHIWTDVCRTNQSNVAGALDRLIDELQELRRSLDRPETIEGVFEASARWRERLPE
jgi:prephenate dehydrogenase